MVDLPDPQSLIAAAEAPFAQIVGTADGARYGFARWVFLRGLGLVHLAAFLSLWTQVAGLVGEEGILPYRDVLDRLRHPDGSPDLGRAPTFLWWARGDGALHAACGAGLVLALLLVLGVAPAPALLGLWALYLSLAAAGSVFLSYQWDVLLVEASFLGIFLAPWGLLTGPVGGGAAEAASPTALFLLWWLLFRLVFQSGLGKLTSGDASWRDLTALEYHWWTQPLPTWTAWWIDQLPRDAHRAATLATHVLELLFPLLIFAPRPARLVGFSGLVLLQLLIMATGNYNFFNALAIVLSFLLLDDRAWSAILGPDVVGAVSGVPGPGAGWARTAAVLALAALVLTVGAARLWRTLRPDAGHPALLRGLLHRLDPLRTVNSYGLFRVMTKRRPEIVVQGSLDGETWHDYAFRWKPGDPGARPRFCVPHQPRLDWQMWFAALGSFPRTPWFHAFLARLLEGSPAVEELLDETPFAEERPAFVRAVLYEYRFTGRDERRETGRWWSREEVGLYAPPTSLDRER